MTKKQMDKSETEYFSNTKIQYVCNDNSYKLSDQRLLNMLSVSFEKGQVETNKKHWYSYFGYGLSVAFTLFLTCITSTFNDVGSIEGKTLIIVAWVAVGLAFLYGVIGAWFYVKNHTMNEKNLAVRDKVVKEIMEEYLVISKDGTE